MCSLFGSLLMFGASGEPDRRGGSGDSPGHLHRPALAGVRLQGKTGVPPRRRPQAAPLTSAGPVCVPQLVEVRGRPRMKISEDPEKSTVPGRKQVFRLADSDGGDAAPPLTCPQTSGLTNMSRAGRPFLDLLCLAGEAPPEPGVPLGCFPLGAARSSVSVTPAQVLRLRQEVFVDGQVRTGAPPP